MRKCTRARRPLVLLGAAAAVAGLSIRMRMLSGKRNRARMGGNQSSSASAPVNASPPATHAQHASPTKVEMADGRVVSYDSFVQESMGRFMPARSTRKSQALTPLSIQIICRYNTLFRPSQISPLLPLQNHCAASQRRAPQPLPLPPLHGLRRHLKSNPSAQPPPKLHVPRLRRPPPPHPRSPSPSPCPLPRQFQST